MADIIIRGKYNEAKIVDGSDPGSFTYECSQGVWCGLTVRESTNRLDVIESAIIHVDRHDKTTDV